MQTCHQLLRFVGLTLRHHSVSFLRGDLAQRRIVACAKPMASRDGRWLKAAGIILMRQMHGRPKDSCSSRSKPRRASPILWFGRRCSSRTGRTILSAGMLGIRGRIQRAGEVVHLVAHQLTDLSAALAGVGERDDAFPVPHGRGEEVHHGGSGPDPRELPARGLRARNFYDPYGHIDEIKVKTRDFK